MDCGWADEASVAQRFACLYVRAHLRACRKRMILQLVYAGLGLAGLLLGYFILG